MINILNKKYKTYNGYYQDKSGTIKETEYIITDFDWFEDIIDKINIKTNIPLDYDICCALNIWENNKNNILNIDIINNINHYIKKFGCNDVKYIYGNNCIVCITDKKFKIKNSKKIKLILKKYNIKEIYYYNY